MFTPCASTPPRALGRILPRTSLFAPRLPLCSRLPCAPTPPRTLGRVHTLRAHTIPCIGACPHPARPHHPAHWGVPTPCTPTSPRALGRAHTLRAPPTISRMRGRANTLRAQPSRALGRAHIPRAHTTPCIGVCPYPARPPPRALGAYFLALHSLPRPSFVRAYPAHPHHLVHWRGVFTPCASTPPRGLEGILPRTSLFAPPSLCTALSLHRPLFAPALSLPPLSLCPASLCSRLPPRTRYEKKSRRC